MTIIQYYCIRNFHQFELPNNHLIRLNHAQRARIDSMSTKRKYEFFFSRQLLNFAMAKHQPDQKWDLTENENGAPSIRLFDNNQSVSCSITHSPTWLGIVICIAKNPPKIGIDIEAIKGNWNVKKAKLFCSNTQVHHAFGLDAITERNYFLTTLWTQKEAYFKAGGEHVFNNNIELKEGDETPYLLISEPLADDSVMSIYSERKAVINKTELSYLNEQFIPI